MIALMIGLVVLVLAIIWLYLAERITLPTASPTIESNLPTKVSDFQNEVSLEDIRFATVLRGYRMDQVDSVIEHLVARIQKQEEQLGKLAQHQHQNGCD